MDGWRTLPRLAALVAKDPGFRQFVLASVNATLDTNDFLAIRSNAQKACPAGTGALCNDLVRHAIDAIAESGADHPKQ
jgi:hypothetical protein